MNNDTIFSRISELCKRNNLSIAALERKLGFGNGTVKKWANVTPSGDRLDKVAKEFGVTVDYLLNGYNQSDGYYLNDETAQIAQEIFDNPDMRGLFDIARDTSPERLKTYYEFLKKLHDQDNNL